MALALFQAREHHEDLLDVFLEIFQVVEIGAHLQVFQHRHAGENAAAFRRLGDALARDQMRRQLGNILAVEDDLAGLGLRCPADCHHQRRLAGAVGTDQADDLALVDLDIDARERADIAVIGFDTLDFQEGFTGHQTVPSSIMPLSSFSSISSTSSSSTPR
ncbi:hypothetical protein D3C80_458780 [compost metagenome]